MLMAEIAPSMGIRVELEPQYQFAGELIFPNGSRHLFRNTNFNINPAGSTEIAKDKAYTCFFLRKHGINVPDNETFFSDKLNANLPAKRRRGLADAQAYAQTLGFPVFIKPNNLSQGAFVTKVWNAAQIAAVAEQIFARTDVLLIERACPGRDYRVVVLGDKIISAYERVALAVTGDGERSIRALLAHAKSQLTTLGRPNCEIDLHDPRIDLKLAASGHTWESVLPDGCTLTLMDNANLSTGGTSTDVTDTIDPSFAAIAIAATQRLGLRLCGVDILADDLTQDSRAQSWTVLELNAAPGLDNYASLGHEQAERVKGLYRQVLEYLSRHAV
jgi:D-alanine-D-alanine ligase-like ATP-grasp enzyme